MTKDELLALADKVEALEGPSREVGMEVLLACGWTKTRVGYFLGPLYGWTSPDRTIYFQEHDFQRGKWNPTQFLDAALTLVPEGWDYSVERVEGEYWAGVSLGDDQMPVLRAATPALALCAAALRALAQQEQQP